MSLYMSTTLVLNIRKTERERAWQDERLDFSTLISEKENQKITKHRRFLSQSHDRIGPMGIAVL